MLLTLYRTLPSSTIVYLHLCQSHLHSLNIILIIGTFRTTLVDNLLCELTELWLNVSRYKYHPKRTREFKIQYFSLICDFFQHSTLQSRSTIKINQNTIIAFFFANVNPSQLTYISRIDLSLTVFPKSQTNYVQNFKEKFHINITNRYKHQVRLDIQ